MAQKYKINLVVFSQYLQKADCTAIFCANIKMKKNNFYPLFVKVMSWKYFSLLKTQMAYIAQEIR